MSALRRVLLLVAGASFAAGVGVGLAAHAVQDLAQASQQADNDAFVQRLATTYGLDRHQVRELRAVLLMRDDELMRIAKSFDVERWPPEAQSQLLAAQQRMQKRIEYVLDENQRKRYRQDLAKYGEVARGAPAKQQK